MESTPSMCPFASSRRANCRRFDTGSGHARIRSWRNVHVGAGAGDHGGSRLISDFDYTCTKNPFHVPDGRNRSRVQQMSWSWDPLKKFHLPACSGEDPTTRFRLFSAKYDVVKNCAAKDCKQPISSSCGTCDYKFCAHHAKHKHWACEEPCCKLLATTCRDQRLVCDLHYYHWDLSSSSSVSASKPLCSKCGKNVLSSTRQSIGYCASCSAFMFSNYKPK